MGKVYSGSPWESEVGYCRAIRKGNIVEVAGATAMKDGEVIGKGDSYTQTYEAIKIIEKSLEEVGASLKDVVRTRMFVTDISQWESIGKAHGEFFKEIQPVSTMVEVKALIDSELLVEIEAQAIVED